MKHFRDYSMNAVNQHTNFAPILTEELDEHVHTHEYFEIFYITLGSITHIYSDKHEPMTVGDACLICLDNAHNFKRSNAKCSHRDVLIDAKIFKEACDYIAPTFYDSLIQQKYVRFSLSTETIAYLERCFSKMLESGDTIRRRNYERIMTVILLSHIYFGKKSIAETPSTFKDKCIDLINSHFTQQNALELIRNKLGYNDIYFSRKFKREFGCTPTEKITNMRLEHAVYLLTSSNYTLDECCEAVGIYSLPYFIKIFKRKYGMTPSQYKNHLKKIARERMNPEEE